jgi:hypothetical protein
VHEFGTITPTPALIAGSGDGAIANVALRLVGQLPVWAAGQAALMLENGKAATISLEFATIEALL